jgi:hypothetical protein
VAHGILKDPSRRDKISANGNKFFFSKKFLPTASILANDWSILYRPARRGLNPFGVYYGVVWVEELSVSPDRSDTYVLTLSKHETFDIPLRAVQKGVIYEQSLRENGRRSPEQHPLRRLSDLEFINIIEDCIAQDYYCATPELETDHRRKTAFFQNLADRSRSRFLARFPLDH